MNVASLDLCKKLYELSGWGGTEFEHAREWDNNIKHPNRKLLTNWLLINHTDYHLQGTKIERIPAYDLGYLLRKLPAYTKYGSFTLTTEYAARGVWQAGYAEFGEGGDYWKGGMSVADTPEDAACKRAIELFQQGILKP